MLFPLLILRMRLHQDYLLLKALEDLAIGSMESSLEDRQHFRGDLRSQNGCALLAIRIMRPIIQLFCMKLYAISF